MGIHHSPTVDNIWMVLKLSVSGGLGSPAVRNAPRVFGIPAAEAPIVAVIRRGPSDWSHIGLWRTAEGVYEPGAWLRGTIYPQKCDLSPDGRWFVYSAMKHPADWPGGEIYEAVSRLPWLRALAAWNAGTTYTRGMHFVEERGSEDVGDPDVGDPDVGDARPLRRRYGLRLTRASQFAVEHRRGWAESDSTPPRQAGGPWDERRRVEMVKPQPGGRTTLHVEGLYAGFRSGGPKSGSYVYWTESDGEIAVLDGVQWADWDSDGGLLTANGNGMLQRRTAGGEVTDVADLGELTPDPQPAPDWATEW